MAEMIPDRMPTGASIGEKRVFQLLQKLPDDVIVYYEPVVGQRYPDFVVVLPETGLLIIEVKGWYPGHIVSASKQDVEIEAHGTKEKHRHPVRQAREYQYALMDTARRHRQTAALLHPEGNHEGRFIFPFGHLAILSNCERGQLIERGLAEVFGGPRVLAKDELAELDSLDAQALLECFRKAFDPWWPITRLSDDQVSVLRAILHPEVVVSRPNSDEPATEIDLAVLDLRQERNARSIGEGHRIIYGVAGSGKTVILIARAKMVSSDPGKRCLILCYNRALADHFQSVFAGVTNVDCMNFHAFGGTWGVHFNEQEEEEDYGIRLLEKLSKQPARYDAVFVDEAQDFARSWFHCAKSALKEPDDGDLLIVGDGTQMLYRRRRFTWREAGINAQGRVINRRFDLDRNYRNTRQILEISCAFANAAEGGAPEESLQSLIPDAAAATRNGRNPEIHFAPSLEAEVSLLVSKVRELINSGLKPRDIAVLYRANASNWVYKLARNLAEHVPVNWKQGNNQAYAHPSGVRLSTMHSAKGLQWPAVIIARADMMPFRVEGSDEPDVVMRLERGLMYVAMTRAETQLVFTASSRDGFASQIEMLLQPQAAR